MADENSILGTTGKEAIPFEYQVQEQALGRKRAMAQMLLKQGLTPFRQVAYGNHVTRPGIGGHLLSALQTYMGMKGIGDDEEASKLLAGQVSDARSADLGAVQALANGTPATTVPQQGPPTESPDFPGTPGPDLPPVQMPGQAPDIKAAIARAMASKFGGIQAQGAQMQKDENSKQMEISKILANVDPTAAANRLRTGDTGPIMPPAPPTLTWSTGPGGEPVASTVSPKDNKLDFKFPPKGVSVQTSVDARTGSKVDSMLDEKAVEALSKAKEPLADFQNQFNNIKRITQLVDKGADIGGGASLRQGARQLGAMFGVQIPETGITSELQSRLGENLFAAVRKLAPVTENDVTLVNRLVGSIDTDPGALKELNSFLLSKLLIGADIHNSTVDQAASTSSGDKSKYETFKVKMPDSLGKPDATILRAFQIMKEGGHDMSKYQINGEPVSGLDFNMNFLKPAGIPPNRPAPAGRGKRVP